MQLIYIFQNNCHFTMKRIAIFFLQEIPHDHKPPRHKQPISLARMFIIGSIFFLLFFNHSLEFFFFALRKWLEAWNFLLCASLQKRLLNCDLISVSWGWHMEIWLMHNVIKIEWSVEHLRFNYITRITKQSKGSHTTWSKNEKARHKKKEHVHVIKMKYQAKKQTILNSLWCGVGYLLCCTFHPMIISILSLYVCVCVRFSFSFVEA